MSYNPPRAENIFWLDRAIAVGGLLPSAASQAADGTMTWGFEASITTPFAEKHTAPLWYATFALDDVFGEPILTSYLTSASVALQNLAAYNWDSKATIGWGIHNGTWAGCAGTHKCQGITLNVGTAENFTLGQSVSSGTPTTLVSSGAHATGDFLFYRSTSYSNVPQDRIYTSAIYGVHADNYAKGLLLNTGVIFMTGTVYITLVLLGGGGSGLATISAKPTYQATRRGIFNV